MTNEQVITRIKHNSMYKDDRETADYIIKALEQNTVSEEAYTAEYTARKQAEYELWKIKEQQPCEDCVSRQAVKEGMIKYGFHAPDMTVTEFIEDELPPVTPKIPTSEDCVSRADVIRIAEQGQVQGFVWQFRKLVTMPSVKPTHGTCKDCGWLTTDEDGNYYCIQTGCFDSLDFYCGDFEKRGTKNG